MIITYQFAGAPFETKNGTDFDYEVVTWDYEVPTEELDEFFIETIANDYNLPLEKAKEIYLDFDLYDRMVESIDEADIKYHFEDAAYEDYLSMRE